MGNFFKIIGQEKGWKYWTKSTNFKVSHWACRQVNKLNGKPILMHSAKTEMSLKEDIHLIIAACSVENVIYEYTYVWKFENFLNLGW